jgi:hypothetical protein
MAGAARSEVWQLSSCKKNNLANDMSIIGFARVSA